MTDVDTVRAIRSNSDLRTQLKSGVACLDKKIVRCSSKREIQSKD